MMAENSRRVAELTLKRLIVNGADDPYWMATLDTVDRRLFEPDPADLAEAINRASGVIESEGSTGVTAAALNVREMANCAERSLIASHNEDGVVAGSRQIRRARRHATAGGLLWLRGPAINLSS